MVEAIRKAVVGARWAFLVRLGLALGASVDPKDVKDKLRREGAPTKIAEKAARMVAKSQAEDLHSLLESALMEKDPFEWRKFRCLVHNLEAFMHYPSWGNAVKAARLLALCGGDEDLVAACLVAATAARDTKAILDPAPSDPGTEE